MLMVERNMRAVSPPVGAVRTRIAGSSSQGCGDARAVFDADARLLIVITTMTRR